VEAEGHHLQPIGQEVQQGPEVRVFLVHPNLSIFMILII
jgi:hypothetical protein